MRLRNFCIVVVMWLTAAMFSDLHAGTLTPPQYSLEFLMETQIETAFGIYTLFGPAPPVALNFTSNISATSESFTYSLQPGAMYAGQSITFTGTGIFDPSSGAFGVWTLSGSGTFMGGTVNWSTSGTDTITSPDVKYTSDTDIKREGVKQADFHDDCDVDETKDTSKCSYFITDKDGKMVGKAMPASADMFVESGKSTSWNFSLDGSAAGFVINSTGVTTTGGGIGNFATTITAVPEPISTVPVSFALLGALAAGLIRRSKERQN